LALKQIKSIVDMFAADRRERNIESCAAVAATLSPAAATAAAGVSATLSPAAGQTAMCNRAEGQSSDENNASQNNASQQTRTMRQSRTASIAVLMNATGASAALSPAAATDVC